MKTIFVRIPVASKWPSPSELAARNQVTDSLTAAGIGVFKGAGGGMGEMDFSYNVSDEAVARAEIERIMQQLLPSVQYRLTVSD